jgi:uncharacterized protein (DUF2336 family)
MIAPRTLIAELETAVKSGSIDKRIATMKRVTDLFLNSANTLSESKVEVFDSVLLHIAKRVEAKALEELSRRLAPVRNAPIGVIQHLARHDDIGIAGPVLSQSERLTNSDLIEISKKKSQAHLSAISDRPRIAEGVTDILLERGTNEVFCKLATNSGATFSRAGYESLINRAKDDETLAEKIGQRVDIPRHLLQDLVSKATHAVRIKLLATAPPERHAEIKTLLANISREVFHEIRTQSHDPEGTQKFIQSLQQKKQLNESILSEFARKGELEKLTASLAQMASAPFDLVNRLMRTIHYGGLLVVCRAVDLQWDSVETILMHRHPNHPITALDLDHARADYIDLTKPTALRLLGFWQAQPNQHAR